MNTSIHKQLSFNISDLTWNNFILYLASLFSVLQKHSIVFCLCIQLHAAFADSLSPASSGLLTPTAYKYEIHTNLNQTAEGVSLTKICVPLLQAETQSGTTAKLCN